MLPLFKAHCQLSYIIFKTTHWEKCYYILHPTAEKTEMQREEKAVCGPTPSKWQDLNQAALLWSPHFTCSPLISSLKLWPNSPFLVLVTKIQFMTNPVVSLMLNHTTFRDTSTVALTSQGRKNRCNCNLGHPAKARRAWNCHFHHGLS